MYADGWLDCRLTMEKSDGEGRKEGRGEIPPPRKKKKPKNVSRISKSRRPQEEPSLSVYTSVSMSLLCHFSRSPTRIKSSPHNCTATVTSTTRSSISPTTQHQPTPHSALCLQPPFPPSTLSGELLWRRCQRLSLSLSSSSSSPFFLPTPTKNHYSIPANEVEVSFALSHERGGKGVQFYAQPDFSP